VIYLALGKKFGEELLGMEPDLVDVCLHFVLGHLFFGVVIALVRLANKMEGFGFAQDDDVDVLALLLLFVMLTAKGDDVGDQGDIRSSTMSPTTLILCQIVLKYMF
jgi:hypothetical protein